jgi:flagellar basal-body rod protein FlgB
MDGNTVNLDTEMTKLAENQLMYEISIRFLTRKFNGIKNAIMEGGR